MSEPIVKPYATLPVYADVDYVDGKLRVASGIVRRTKDPDLRRWLQTIDILLSQRTALADLAARPVPADHGTDRADEEGS